MIRETVTVLAVSLCAMMWPAGTDSRGQWQPQPPPARPAPPSKPIPPPPAQYKEIRHILGRCLDVAGGVNENRNDVQIFDCNRSRSQQWTLTNRREVRNVMGRCLDVAGGVNANRVSVQIFDCNGTRSQQWAFTHGGALRNVMGRCLDVEGGLNANRINVQIFDCNGSKGQQWQQRTIGEGGWHGVLDFRGTPLNGFAAARGRRT